MSEQTDFLEAQFSAVVHPAEDPDWLDVRRRARCPRRRRWLLVPLAATIAAIAVGSALGLYPEFVDFFSAEPAPERVVVEFGQLSVRSAIHVGGPHVHAGSARKISEATFRGRRRALFVAPTADGGFCWMWEKWNGSCGRTAVMHSTDRPLSTTWLASGSGGAALLTGHVIDPDVVKLEIIYEDRGRAAVRLLWVSRPIDAGFFLFETPPEHLRHGRRVKALVALDADGDEVAREPFPFNDPRWDSGPDGLPRIANRSRKRTVFDFRDHNGQQWTLVTAPAPGDRVCWAYNRGGGCISPQFPPIIGGMSIQPGEAVNVCCAVSSDVAIVELRYEDGTRTKLEPVDGFLLYVIPPEHYAAGHRPETLAWLREDGTETASRSFDTAQPGIYPCARGEEKQLEYGVRICP
jgi:hypothetical protein